MIRLQSPQGSLTGSWRPGHDEARILAQEAQALRGRLTRETADYLARDASALSRSIRDLGDVRRQVAIEAGLVAMASPADWFGRKARTIGRAQGALRQASDRPTIGARRRAALRAHADKIDALRGAAGEIIHLKMLACMATKRARDRSSRPYDDTGAPPGGGALCHRNPGETLICSVPWRPRAPLPHARASEPGSPQSRATPGGSRMTCAASLARGATVRITR